MQKRNMKYASKERDRFTKTMHKNHNTTIDQQVFGGVV